MCAAGVLMTMAYGRKDRLWIRQQPAPLGAGTSTATYLYAADNMKRVENVDGAMTTLVWTDQATFKGGNNDGGN